MANGDEMVRELTPSWDASGVFQMAAAPGSGCAQFGSLIVPETNTRAAIGYRRYRDCDKNDSPGQDFAVVRGDRRHLVGVLADGVGQSFFGNLAAERVSKWLLRELWNKRAEPPGQEEMEAGLKIAEQELSGVVEEYSLEHLPAWHRNALEGTRRAGSQAVFAAFVWEFARQRGCLYQVGDAVSIVFRSGGSEKIEAYAKGRWSSAGRSKLHLLCTPLVETVGLLLKSDGADPAWGFEIDREIADGLEFAEMASRRAEGDDVSFVAGCLVTEARAVSGKKYRRVTTAPRPASAASTVASGGALASSGVSGTKASEEVPAKASRSATPARLPTKSGRFRSSLLVFAIGVACGLLFSAFEPKLARLVPLKRWWGPQVLSPSAAQRPTGGVTGKPTGGSGSPADPPGTPARQQALKAVPAVTSQSESTSLPAIVTPCKAPPTDVKTFLRRDPAAAIARVTSGEQLIGLAVDGSVEHFTVRSDLDPRDGVWYVFLPKLTRGVRLHAYLRDKAAEVEKLIQVGDKPGCFSYEVPPGASDQAAKSPEGTSK